MQPSLETITFISWMFMNKDKLLKRSIARFWKSVIKTDTCWLWIGRIDDCGYGCFWGNGKSYQAHRFSMEIRLGRPLKPTTRKLDGELVLHNCDTACCVNPYHLKLGTQAKNIKDRDDRERQSKGTNRPQHKLTEDDVRTLRKDYEQGKATLTQLTKRYGVHLKTLWCAVKGITWKHV